MTPVEAGPGLAPVERRCTALVKRTGQQCRRWAIAGGTVCPMHGGRAPQVKAAAARRLVEARVERELAGLLADAVDATAGMDPLDVLEVQLRRQHAWATACWWLLGEVHPDQTYGPDHLDDARPHVLVEMHRVAARDAAATAKLAKDAGLEERRVQLAEDVGQRIVAVLRAAIDGLFVLLDGVVEPGVLEALRVERLPGLIRGAIDATAEEAT